MITPPQVDEPSTATLLVRQVLQQLQQVNGRIQSLITNGAPANPQAGLSAVTGADITTALGAANVAALATVNTALTT